MMAVLSSSNVVLILMSTMRALAQTDFAQITQFTITGATGSDDKEANLGDRLTIECRASGQPPPLVSIWKGDEQGVVGFYSRSGDSYDSNMVIVTATCLDNGPYQCRARNTFRGEPYVDVDQFSLSVICPPTSCSGTPEPQVIAVKPGRATYVDVCVIGFPSPSASSFHLEKETLNGWEVHTNAVVELVGSGRYLTGLSIDFPFLNLADLGHFRAVHQPTGNGSVVYIYFQLIEKTNSELSKEAIIGIAAAGLVVVILIVTLIACCCCCQGKNNRVKELQQPPK